ncbi:hypothetical protein [Maridesulfovibrio zosterae]|uniref:hypothetical protein n=1 Tax=Maridesulfovibrio zosterae TaxID=82171 RepID=UPI000406EFB0|nr:hypothetical protein [Maridesulfovibrio zosterae]
MITAMLAAKDSAWTGGTFDGERCHCCGQIEQLGSFKMEAVSCGKKIVHESRLCSECMQSAENIVSLFLERKHVQ